MSESVSKFTALLVDDSAFVLKQLKQILISENFIIVGTAENGTDAVALYKELKPALVTMDISFSVYQSRR